MTHEQLMLITRTMPMKTIEVNGYPYLERYFVGEKNGTQEWLHRFLRADSERHLHSHPWTANSTILCGWYVEEWIDANSAGKRETLWHKGAINFITPSTIHRIVDVKPGTWTHMRVYGGRESSWFFINDDGEKEIMQTSPINWHLSCNPRSC